MGHGFEKLIDVYISLFMTSLSNNFQNVNNIHQKVDKLVSDAIDDIDNRLNKHPEDHQEG